jgi:prephenate dehydrogenase
VHFQKVTVAGVGLLGASLALALKQTGLASRVDGLVRRSASIAECEKLGVVDRATRNPLLAAEHANLIIVCTPLGTMEAVVESMLPAIRPGTLVTDVGSVKSSVVRTLEPMLAKVGAHFVGSHPMAGSEQTGPATAKPGLFQDAICVVTPTSRTPASVLKQVQGMWKSVGGKPLILGPEDHDDLVSRSSHLPHILAAELASYVLSPAHPKEQPLLCATGFRDTTRVASGSPQVWRDIAMANRENLARVLAVYIEGLQEVHQALQESDHGSLLDFFERAQTRRNTWISSFQSASSDE